MNLDPSVQNDFPIDWEKDSFVSRREFFKFLTLAGAGLAVGTGAALALGSRSRSQIAFEPKLIGRLSDVAVGAALPFTFPRAEDICLLVRPTESELVAYKRRCTHLSCPVEWQPEHDRLYCPCHNGAFAIRTGEVLQGPPPRRLPQIVLSLRGEEIWAIGIREETTA